MPFLEGYQQISAQNAPEQVAYFYKWLRSDWRTMYDELRAKRPVLKTPAFTLITRANDVQQVITNDSFFTVDAYKVAMDAAIGPFMLARDNSEQNYHEKSVMRSVMSWDDLPGVAQLVEQVTGESLCGADGRIELVSKVGRLVPLRILTDHFGFDNATDAELIAWSRAAQADIFRNPSGKPEIHEPNVRAGLELRARALRLIADKLTDREKLVHSNKPIDRLILRLHKPGEALTVERAISNVCGLLVGAVETINQAIIQIIQVILSRPDIRQRAVAAAKCNDMEQLRPITWEALRFDPITTFVARRCVRDFQLAVGDELVTIKSGETIAACIGSAMFDSVLFPDPTAFRVDRPERSYMHFGFGPHICLGQYVAGTAIPHAVKRVLQVPGIQLIDGPEGKIDYGDMHFPEKFYVSSGHE